jgi:hypothetical protein
MARIFADKNKSVFLIRVNPSNLRYRRSIPRYNDHQLLNR